MSTTTPGADALYWQALAAGQFRIQRCSACARHVFYGRVLCPHCGADSLQWVDASGRGTVYSTTVVRGKPGEGKDRNIVLVDLAEGPRLMSRVEDIDASAVRIGMQVRAEIRKQGETPLLVFVPAERTV